MRLLSYRDAGALTWGVQTAAGVVDCLHLGTGLPSSLQGFVEACADQPGLAASVAAFAAASQVPAQALASLELLPVMPHPGKIICLGVNYVDHAKEGGNTVADYPALFLRTASSLLAHGAPLRVPSISTKLDYEAELALVIGRRTRFVSEADALASVFGYACFNDATLRDYQIAGFEWLAGLASWAPGASNVAPDGWIRDENALGSRYPHQLIATTPGSGLTLPFTGSAIGFLWMVANDGGDIRWHIDDHEPRRLSSWDMNPPRTKRTSAVILSDTLEPGDHQLHLRVLPDKHDKSEGTTIRIGAFLIGS